MYNDARMDILMFCCASKTFDAMNLSERGGVEGVGKREPTKLMPNPKQARDPYTGVPPYSATSIVLQSRSSFVVQEQQLRKLNRQPFMYVNMDTREYETHARKKKEAYVIETPGLLWTPPSHLAGVALDDDVATLADLAGFRGDSVRGTGVGAGEVVVVQLVLGGHGRLQKTKKTSRTEKGRENIETACYGSC